MKLKVICRKCDRIFSWDAEKEIETCPYCDSELTIKDVRMNPNEILRYKKYRKTHRQGIPQETIEETRKENIQIRPVAQKEEKENPEGRYIIKKGSTKYGTIELTNPDYMILKLSFWAMGPAQKDITTSLTRKILNDLGKNGFDIKKR